jgi:hypothetical protein
LRLTTVSHAYKRWWIFTPGRRGHHGCDRMGVGFTNTIFCDLFLKSAFEWIFNVMQLILVKIK